MNEYDIGKAFEAIEDELIASMMRNMQRHRDWEDAEGFNWSMWQAEQLKSLNQYKRDNKKKFSKQFNGINRSIKEVIEQARKQGNMEQEIQILSALKKGWKPKRRSGQIDAAKFFRMNDRKLNALIKATEKDFERAEVAMLRRANDQYRKVIFNAQVYANTGAGTYEKAVDMATRDFLSAGINCIEYKDGARHTMSDYSDMAIRTAAKRAYLTGEGEKRNEWGISTVIVNKRGNPCPKCLPFVGKIMIDDVWSGGKASAGSYPLMSSAIAAGLYHPRCKDSHTTYFQGISSSDDKWTEGELETIEKANKEEDRKKYAQRQAEKTERLATYSLDPDSKQKYAKRVEQWTEKAATPKAHVSGPEEKLQSEALEWYVSGEGQWVNHYFRDKDFGSISVMEKELIDAIDTATQNEIVQESVLYRSVDASSIFPGITQGEFETLKGAVIYGDTGRYAQAAKAKYIDNTKGKTITENGFMSTTKDQGIALNWEGYTGSDMPIVLELDRVKGINGKDLRKFDVDGEEQFEVLLAKGQQYEINKITHKEGQIYVKANILSRGDSLKTDPQLLYPKNRDKLNLKIIGNYESEIAKIPAEHLEIIDKGISEIEIIKEGASRFDREKKKLYLRHNFEDGELIHEMAHVLETELDIYNNTEFQRIVLGGVEDYSLKDVIYNPNTFVEPVYLIEHDKLVSKYQGRVYIEVGIFGKEGTLNPFALGEYFSEGYREYLLKPQALKRRDPDLYKYIEGMVRDNE